MMSKTGNECFSVVLCTHNGEQFIEEQIRSILCQSGGVDRIYVHDFASTDGTRRLLERLKADVGKQLEVAYHESAPGAAASFLHALKLTVPKLNDRSLVFLADQDDVWLPTKLETIRVELARRVLSSRTPFVLFHDVRVVDDKLHMLRPTYYTGNPFRIPRDLDRSRLMMANPAIGHTMLMSAPLIRLLADWPDLERYMMHDWLAILIASRVGRVEQVPLALSLYRQHDSNILGAYRTRGKIASVSRLLRFTDAMVDQAVSFSRAVYQLSLKPGAREVYPARLESLCRHGYRLAAFALSAAAIVYGPTWQRKALGLLLLARGIAGPIDKNKLRRPS